MNALAKLIERSFKSPLQTVLVRARWVVCLVTIGFLGASVGYPQWRPAQAKSEEAFPCRSRGCGCRTAEQCRTNCCCFTKSEKIAWALEQGVDPNSVAILTAEEQRLFTIGRLTVAVNDTRVSKSSCCGKKSSCCSKKQVASCCEAKKRGSSRQANVESSGSLVFVAAIEAQKCQGRGIDWIRAGFIGLPPLVYEPAGYAPHGRVVAIIEPRYLTPSYERLVPPG